MDSETEFYSNDANAANTAYDKYPYPFCKVDTNYFDYTVIDGHKKTNWQAADFTPASPREQV